MEENKIVKLLDKEYLIEFFKEKLATCYDNLLGVEIEFIKPIKKHIWHTTYHVVISYNLNLLFENGQNRQKIVYVTAHDHEPRKQVLETLRFLADCGFSRGKYLVPKPLFYDEFYNATFYEGVIGENLYHYIKENNRPVINQLVDQSARWFSHLHDIHNGVSTFYENQNRLIETVSPGREAVMSLIEQRFPEYSKKYEKIYSIFINAERKYLLTHKKLSVIHGDAHPENVIQIVPNKLALIDFVDMSIGDRARDLGCFLQQLEYMALRKIGDAQYADELKELFLTSYLKYAKLKRTPSLLKRIERYYLYTAIRTASFFLLKHEPEPERAAPLINEVCKALNIKD